MKTVKELVWKLDREIWAHVPDGGQSEPWTASKAREESNKLIIEFVRGRLRDTLDYIIQNCSAEKQVISKDGFSCIDKVVSVQTLESFKDPYII